MVRGYDTYHTYMCMGVDVILCVCVCFGDGTSLGVEIGILGLVDCVCFIVVFSVGVLITPPLLLLALSIRICPIPRRYG